MEFESNNGSKIRLQPGSEPFDFGRGLGYNSTDRTVSRRHISFKPHDDQARVYFQVEGKNPVWVRDSRNDEIRVYKSSEGGEINSGDSFCVSAKNPLWFNLKRIGCEDEECNESKSEIRLDDAFAETSGIDYDEIEAGDISNIDPVKEFNFVIMGHEFDCYPKKMIRDIRNWDWFLEEPKEESEEDELGERKAKKGIRRKRKKGGGDDEDDEVWTGESEEEAETVKKLRNIPKPKYSTRSKNKEKNKKCAGASKSAKDATNRHAMDDEDEDEDEDDETLSGFIVDDEDAGEGNIDDDEEEEEFEEDEDDE